MKTFTKHAVPGEPVDAGKDWNEVRARGGYDDLRDSIAEHGVQNPVLMDMQTGKVKDGHHRAASLMDLGASHVPVIDYNRYGWPHGYH
jgi:ParB-like chromosome segregation protein Spo0J